ncbi:heme-binding protein, partial [Streptomyces sp. NPDC058877]
MKKILLGATAAAVVAAGTFGVVSANAAAPAAVPAAVTADATGQNTVESTHLTIEAAVKAARATLDAAGAEGQRV